MRSRSKASYSARSVSLESASWCITYPFTSATPAKNSMPTAIAPHANAASQVRVPRRGEAEGENGPRLERVDDAVVPQAGGRVIGRALRLVLLADPLLEALPAGVVLERADESEDRRGLVAAHHADARVRPHP